MFTAAAAGSEGPAALARLGGAAWRLLSSVKLGVFWLILLAALSAIGTIIPQTTGQLDTFQNYVAKLGPERAALYAKLGLLNVYHSWWFVTVLTLMCLSIAAASIDRWPRIFGEFSKDDPVPPASRFRGPFSRSWVLVFAHSRFTDLHALFAKQFGTPQVSRIGPKEIVLYSNRGRWTRLGVYFVHAGILITSAGAVLGNFTGFTRAHIYIPEGGSTSSIELLEGISPTGEATAKTHHLPFELRCDDFEAQFYNDPKTGVPTEKPSLFRSRLTVLENGREVLTRDIFVNDPLRYKGYTFYQENYDQADPLIRITAVSRKSGERYPVNARFNEPFQLPGEEFRYVVRGSKDNFEIPGSGPAGPAVGIEMLREDGELATVNRGGQEHPVRFLIFRDLPAFDAGRGAAHILMLEGVDQGFRTGLQVANDPGVWVVWLGSALMIFGMCLAFFVSHRQSWLRITSDGICFGGAVHKHRLAFENRIAAFCETLERELPAARPSGATAANGPATEVTP